MKKLSKRYKIAYHVMDSPVDCEFFMEPCYSLEIEKDKPLAFVVSINYKLVNTLSNEFYRIVQP
jgi:hypothetical protein